MLFNANYNSIQDAIKNKQWNSCNIHRSVSVKQLACNSEQKNAHKKSFYFEIKE